MSLGMIGLIGFGIMVFVCTVLCFAEFIENNIDGFGELIAAIIASLIGGLVISLLIISILLFLLLVSLILLSSAF
mgnify:CR=1 FL=1